MLYPKEDKKEKKLLYSVSKKINSIFMQNHIFILSKFSV
jgi:hypothetical protein